jgi:hypothetical protein
MSFIYKEGGNIAGARLTIIGGVLFIAISSGFIGFGPIYNVWASGKAGEAELAQAEYNRQIIVRQAQAKFDASTLEAQAAVQHAHGVADSNKIIANDLGGPEGYLRFLYIQMLSEQTNSQIIYIPTEAGLPILQAGHNVPLK